jgi:hypothetical protein
MQASGPRLSGGSMATEDWRAVHVNTSAAPLLQVLRQPLPFLPRLDVRGHFVPSDGAVAFRVAPQFLFDALESAGDGVEDHHAQSEQGDRRGAEQRRPPPREESDPAPRSGGS